MNKEFIFLLFAGLLVSCYCEDDKRLVHQFQEIKSRMAFGTALSQSNFTVIREAAKAILSAEKEKDSVAAMLAICDKMFNLIVQQLLKLLKNDLSFFKFLQKHFIRCPRTRRDKYLKIIHRIFGYIQDLLIYL